MASYPVDQLGEIRQLQSELNAEAKAIRDRIIAGTTSARGGKYEASVYTSKTRSFDYKTAAEVLGSEIYDELVSEQEISTVRVKPIAGMGFRPKPANKFKTRTSY